MDVARMVAAQTRIERQDTPHAASASFDFAAANAFQSYVSSAIAFSIKRGGIMYGTGGWGVGGVGWGMCEANGRSATHAAAPRVLTVPCSALLRYAVLCRAPRAVDEEGAVFVNAIYEPPQSGNADSLQLERGTEEERQADFIAERLG